MVANEDTMLRTMFMIVSMLRKPGNICCVHKMFLKEIRNIFVSRTNVARAGKRGNICVRNIVSSFAPAFKNTQKWLCTYCSPIAQSGASIRRTVWKWSGESPRGFYHFSWKLSLLQFLLGLLRFSPTNCPTWVSEDARSWIVYLTKCSSSGT